MPDLQTAPMSNAMMMWKLHHHALAETNGLPFNLDRNRKDRQADHRRDRGDLGSLQMHQSGPKKIKVRPCVPSWVT